MEGEAEEDIRDLQARDLTEKMESQGCQVLKGLKDRPEKMEMLI